jgi:hypothetical protein
MGGKITEAEASAITEEASITRKHLSADNLARFLGVTFEQRQRLGLTTIGSINVKRQARKELRKLRNCKAHERRRRAQGITPRAEYEATSVAAKAREEGVSRMTIYRRRKTAEGAKNTPHVTGVSAAIFLSSEDGPVTPVGVKGPSERGFASKKVRCPATRGAPKAQYRATRGLPSSQTATTLAAEGHESLPIELRLLALGLPLSISGENFASAA